MLHTSDEGAWVTMRGGALFCLSVAFLVACGREGTRIRAQAPALPPTGLTASAPTARAVPVQACGSILPRAVDATENIFGVRSADPFRWMEGNENPELVTWLKAQGECAEGYLARMPGRAGLLKRLRALGLGASSVDAMRLAGGRAFFRQVDPGERLPKLVVREPNGQQRVLVDPASLGQGGRHVSVDEFDPSPNGKLVAYDLALGGSEVSQIHVMDVEKGTDLADVIERVWGENCVSWLPDSKSFLYTQMALAKPDVDPLQNMQARYHVLGQPPEKDVPLLGRDAPGNLKVAPVEFPHVRVDPGASWAIAAVLGAHREQRLAVASLSKLDMIGAGKTPWRVVAEYADQVEDAFVRGDRMYLLTFKGASNREVVSVPLSDPDLSKPTVEVAEDADATLVGFANARDALYFETMVRGRARLWRRVWGRVPVQVALPSDGWIDELVTDPLRDGARFDLKGWTQPTAFYDVDAKKGTSSPTGIGMKTNADYGNIVVDEVEATSSDGTLVPLSILHPRDLPMDGSRPAILYGYGSYGVSETPSFWPSRLAWLERGASYAVCHVRGGGEKGRKWQDDGSHERKMNGVHDFEACAQYLTEHKFTSPSHLAARGSSAGGILVGRAITDRPELFVAAHVAAGILNPTRILQAENGANQKFELGDPETESGYKSLFQMDSYQHVRQGTPYPSVLFTVGLNDRRVAPWMTGKMAARLQAETTSGKPVLIRVEADAGHGIGSGRDQVYAELADAYGFLLAAAGDPAFQSP